MGAGVLSILLRSFLRGLCSAIFRIVAQDVRPELDQLRSYDSFSGDGQAAGNGIGGGTFRGRIVDIRDGRTDQVANHVGVVRSPASVIALTPYRGGGCPQCAAADAAGAFLEITGILMPQAGQYGIAEKVADEGVGVVCAVALGVTLDALSIFMMVVLRLAKASDNGR